jgi:hypothetical protein
MSRFRHVGQLATISLFSNAHARTMLSGLTEMLSGLTEKVQVKCKGDIYGTLTVSS